MDLITKTKFKEIGSENSFLIEKRREEILLLADIEFTDNGNRIEEYHIGSWIRLLQF